MTNNETLLPVNQIKPTEICGAMAHDIKNIFVGIKMYCSLLKKEATSNSNINDLTNVIEDNSNDALQMIFAYLDSSRFENQNLKLDKHLWDMNKRIKSIVHFIRPAAKNKNININVTYAQTEALLMIDRLKIRRVMINVLTNAIKYTPKGGVINLNISTTNSHIEVSFSDTGIGIPKKLLPYIFDRYTIARRKGTENEKTTGIGLWTSKKIIELHGGEITVSSKPDKGSTFKIILPKHIV